MILRNLMASENFIPELSWICAFLFLTVVILLVLTCVCFKDNEKSQEYGTAGRLSITRDSPILHLQARNGATLSISSRHSDLSSDDGNPKRNSWTVKDRALPEIPDSINNQSITENGILIGNMGITEQVKVKNRNKAMAPKPPGSDPCKVFPLNGSALMSSEDTPGLTVKITVNDSTQVIGNNTSSSELGAKPRIPVGDSVPSTSNSMVILKKVERKESTDPPDEASNHLSNLYDFVGENTSGRCAQTASVSSSPVCIKVEDPNTISIASEEEIVNSPSASLAVAGAVPSSDIPYMTPPLLHNPSPSFELTEDNNNAGSRSEVPYTVISVREPLARVREITMRKQRTAVQQNSEESEDHYAMVPEEEQMYAEIGSGHDSGSSSMTYAHIEPRELPPVPPTVESLKSVAHAHSRQASTVSTCSFNSNVSSLGEPASPSTLSNPTSLYSTVEKNNKQRKTIHLAEGVSLVTATAEKRKKVEDLYAKVRKKRVDLTISTSTSEDYSAYQGVHGENIECITPPPSPWASTTPPAPPPIAGRLQAATLSVLLPGSSHHIRRHSADPNLPEVISDNRVFSGSTRSSLIVSNIKTNEDPNYERIYNEENISGDSCYEKIKEETVVNGHQTVSYNSTHQSEIIPSESSYPGYESVKDEDDDSADPGYECVAHSSRENDPGYEPVRVLESFDDSDSNSDYTVVKLDEIREPGYEVVKNLMRSGSDVADPGYEKIKKVPRTDSDATDPGYERVKNKSLDSADPGYETVQKSDSDTDPCYEIVHGSNVSSVQFGEENSVHCCPSVSHNSESTILFVSGNSETHSHPNHSQNNHHNGINEPSATFL